MAIELTTLADVKLALGITGSGSDDVITDAIESAESTIASVCNRPSGFLTATHTEYYDGSGSSVMWLTHTPVTSITSLSVVYGASDSTAITATAYTFNADGRVWRYPDSSFAVGVRSLVFPEGTNNIQAVYVGGYADQTAVPPDLQRAARVMSVSMYASRSRDMSLQSESLGSYSWAAGSSPESVLSSLHDVLLRHTRGPVV